MKKILFFEQYVDKYINHKIEPVYAHYFYLTYRFVFPIFIFLKIYIYHPELSIDNLISFYILLCICIIELIIYIKIQNDTIQSWQSSESKLPEYKIRKLNLFLITKLDKYIAVTLIIDYVILFVFYLTVINYEVEFTILIAYIIVIFHSFYFPSYVYWSGENSWRKKFSFKYFFTGGAFVSSILWLGLFWLVYPNRSAQISKYMANGGIIQGVTLTIIPFVLILVVSYSALYIRRKYQRLWADKEFSENKEVEIKIETRKLTVKAIKNQNRILKFILEVQENYFTNTDKNKQFDALTKLIVDRFKVEYCCIGHIKGDLETGLLVDESYWILGRNEKDKLNIIQHIDQVKYCSIEDSLIGRALNIENHPNYTFLCNGYENIRKYINKKNATIYTNYILPSSTLNSAIAQGIVDRNGNLIGYILLLNKLNINKNSIKTVTESDIRSFPKSDQKTIQVVAKQIGLNWSNLKLTEKVEQLNTDEKNITHWSTQENADKLYLSLLTYLNDQFNCQLSTFWFPTQNGYQVIKNEDKKTNNLYESDINHPIILLQAIKLKQNSLTGISEENFINKAFSQPYSEGKNNLIGFICNKNFTQPYKHYKDENNLLKVPVVFGELHKNTNGYWHEYMDNLNTDSYITFPIYWTDYISKFELYSEDQLKNFEHIIGIVYMEYNSKIANEDELKSSFSLERIDNLSRNFSILLENLLFRRRFNRLLEFRSALHSVSIDTAENFYYKLVKIVRNVMRCEACTLFVPDEFEGGLTLLASTAEEFQYNNETILVNNLELSKKIIYPFDSTIKSFTLNVYNSQNICANHDESEHIYSNKIFLERINNVYNPFWHESYLAAPLIKNETYESIGVIRCINKKRSESIFRSFSKSDKDFFLLIVGIISRFVEYVKWNQGRVKSASILAHDLHHQINTLDSLLDHPLRRLKSSKPDIIGVEKSLNNVKSRIGKMNSSVQQWFKEYSHFTKESIYKISEQIVKFDFPIGELIADLAEDYKTVARKRNIYIITIGLEKLDLVPVDPSRFTRVITELLENAIKYSDTDTEIVISAEPNFKIDKYNHWIRIIIQNKGLRIEENEVNKIFEYGRRGINTNKHESDPYSQGFGLASAYKNIALHNGKLHLISKPGSTLIRFAIDLPIKL